ELFTHDCLATRSSNTIKKFADDTAVISLITGDNERAYKEGRDKEKNKPPSPSVGLWWNELVGVHINKDLTWTHHTDLLIKSTRGLGIYYKRLSPQAEEVQHGLKDTLQLLQVHHRQDPDWYSRCPTLNHKALRG
ncbi:hypothetical protein L3Q82_017740, partial [Scortum barcoo]